MSAGPVYLVASGQDGLLADVAKRAFAATKQKSPRVAVSFAPIAESKDGLAYMKKMMASVFDGCEITPFAVPGEPHATRDGDPAAVVASADIVFVSGGDPVLGARLLKRAGADAWLRAARARGAALFGVSAGSIVLGAYWAEWSEDDPNAPPALVPCLDVAEGLVVDTHNEEDDWDELRAVQRLVRREKPDARVRFVGIPTTGALVVGENGAYDVVGEQPVVLD